MQGKVRIRKLNNRRYERSFWRYWSELPRGALVSRNAVTETRWTGQAESGRQIVKLFIRLVKLPFITVKRSLLGRGLERGYWPQPGVRFFMNILH